MDALTSDQTATEQPGPKHAPLKVADLTPHIEIDEKELAAKIENDGVILRLRNSIEGWKLDEQEKFRKWDEKMEVVRANISALKIQRNELVLKMRSLQRTLVTYKSFQRHRPLGILRLESQLRTREKKIKRMMIARAAKAAQLEAVKRFRAR